MKDEPWPAPRTLVKPLIAALVFAAAFLAFLPCLRNGFVDMDDEVNFLVNPHFRGLAWENIRWMFTTLLGGPYQPLSWLSLAVDHALWGLDPLGYHLTSMLLHAANAALFYVLGLRLLEAAGAAPDGDARGLRAAAAFSALLFALHPLRVESVAWATERRDVLSGFFYLGTLLCYLRARAAASPSDRRRWQGAALSLYAASLLSKAIGVSLPAVLLVLDAYPLRRPLNRREVWLEKLPYLLLAAAAAAVGFLGQSRAETLHSFAEYGAAARLALPAFAAVFYLWKTVLPVGLLPMYEAPARLDPLAWPFPAAAVAFAGLCLLFARLRRRFPAGLAAWLYYLAALSPVIGFVPLGKHLAADRYTYLSCLGWALLAGAGWLRLRAAAATPARLLAAGLLTALGLLTWNQAKVWRDGETLWRHVLARAPRTAFAHNNLGRQLAQAGRPGEAIGHFQEAIRINPAFDLAHNNLGAAFSMLGQQEEAEPRYREAVRLKPDYAEAWGNLALTLDRRGRPAEAVEAYRKALSLKPFPPDFNLAFASALWRTGSREETVAVYRGLIAAGHGTAQLYVDLGYCLAQLGRPAEAADCYREALRLDPNYALARDNLEKLTGALRSPLGPRTGKPE